MQHLMDADDTVSCGHGGGGGVKSDLLLGGFAPSSSSPHFAPAGVVQRGPNPFLVGHHCLLCRCEKPDLPQRNGVDSLSGTWRPLLSLSSTAFSFSVVVSLLANLNVQLIGRTEISNFCPFSAIL